MLDAPARLKHCAPLLNPRWHLRILLQFIAWYPVVSINVSRSHFTRLFSVASSSLSCARSAPAQFEMLLPMCHLSGGPDSSNFSLLVISAVACIVLHNLASARQIERVIDEPLWNTNLPWDQRRALFVVIANSRPTDVNDFRSMGARYSHLPTKIAG